LQTDDNASFSSTTDIVASVQKIAMAAGDKIVLAVPYENEQYLRLNYTMGGTSPTVSLTAWLTDQEPEQWSATADGLQVMFRPVKVRASARGFYGCLRSIGEEFQIASKDDLGSWMEVFKATSADAHPAPSRRDGKPATKPGARPAGKTARGVSSKTRKRKAGGKSGVKSGGKTGGKSPS
jgi:hypothetical protein